MIVYFANRYMDILGMAATDLPDSYTLQHDIKKLDIDSGISTFEMEFLYQDDTHVKAKEIVAVGNYILRYHNDQTEFYTIIESEDDTEKKTIWVYAEDAGLDLLNEIVQPYAAASAQNIAFYINRFTRDSGFEIGLNEVSDRTRTLSWDGSATASERVRSIANQFDAEIGYRFDINKLEVKHKYIDIYERRGTDTEQELRLGREVDKIVEKKSITNLCTCLRVTGGTPEGTNTPITLKGYSYDDGDIYVDNDGYGDLKSRKALEIWSRYLSEAGTGDGHIVGSYSYDTTEQATLCTYAVKELKKRSQPAINYEVSLFYLPENLKVGDNVRIVDDNGELYLSARVLATEERICDKLYRATFGDFIIKDSGISDKVRELAEQFAQTKTMYTWVAYADDEFGTNISTSPVGKKYVGIAANMAVEEVSIADPTVFSWSLIKGDTGTTFTPTVNEDGVISWVNDGGAANPDPVDLTGVVIDNLAVGGKNLLRGTKDLISGASGWSSGHWRTSGSGGTVVYNYTDPQGQTIIKNAPVSKVKGIKITATAANAQIGFCQDYAPIQAQEITQSIWVKGNVGDQIVLQPIWASAPGEEESGSKSFTLDSTKWQRLTFTKTPNHDHESVSLGYVYLYAAAANNVVYFVAPKMEYGNIATDWSPAVEDVDEGINNAAQVAESYITYVSAADGIRVHNEGDTSNYVKVNSNGMMVYKGGSEIASFGDKIVLGASDSADNRVVIGTGSVTDIRVTVYDSDNPPNAVGYTRLDKHGLTTKTRSDYVLSFPADSNSSMLTDGEAKGYPMIRLVNGNNVEKFLLLSEGAIFKTPVQCDAGMATPYIQAQGSSASSSAGTSVTQVTLNTTDLSYIPDSDYSYSSNGVKVAKAGKYRVTASAYIKPGAVASMIGVYILHGSAFNTAAEAVSSFYSAGATGASTTERTIQCGPKIVTLSANEVVFLGVRSSGTAGTVYPNHQGTYLLIERIS